MTYLTAFSKVLPVLLLLLTGIFLRRIQFFQPQTIQELKKLVVNLTLPAVLFLAFSQVSLQPRYLVIVVLVFFACLLVMLLGRALQPRLGFESYTFPLLMTGFEAGMMGYAIFTAVYGIENVYKLGVVDLGQVIFVFFVLVTSLEQRVSGAKPFSQTLLGFLKTPVILAILLGILVNQLRLAPVFLEFAAAEAVLETLRLLGALTSPLVGLIIGYELRFERGYLARPALAVLIRLLIWLPVAWLMNVFIVERFLHLDAGFQAALLTLMILPPPFVIPLFMRASEVEDNRFVVNTLSLSTLAALILFVIVSLVYPPGAI